MKLVFSSRMGLACGVLLSASSAFATPTFSIAQNVKSAFLDTSNLAISESNYSINFSQDAADPALFFNNLGISYGGGWDPNINLSLDLVNGLGFSLGTSLSGAQNIDFSNIVRHNGQVTGGVAPGTYDFTIDFYGGSSNVSNNVLANVYIQLEVVQSLDFIATATSTPTTIMQGGSAQVDVDLLNNSLRDLHTSSWGYLGGGMINGSNALSGSFNGDWFGDVIGSGNSQVDNHTVWTASGTQALGVYSSDLAIIGGYHPGDQHWMRTSITTIEVTPVPEPASIAVLGLGLAAVLRRKRK